MKYLWSAYLFMIYCVVHTVSVKAKSNNVTNFVISKNNSNEKYKNHNMDGWTPIKPTLEYLKLNQRKNCVSIGYFNALCKQVDVEKTKKTKEHKSIVNLFQRDYYSPYGNYVAELVPKLPNHYENPLPRYRQNDRRQFKRFPTNIKRNTELPRFVEEYPSNRLASISFQEAASKYWNRHRYQMFEPIPGQILYPPTVPQFKSNPLNELLRINSRKDDDVANSRHNMNIKTFQSTIFPFFEHESVTKKQSTNKQNAKNRRKFDTTTPAFSMVVEPTTIKISSTTSAVKPTKTLTIDAPIQYVYSEAVNQSNKNNGLNDFEKELPRKVVLEAPPKKSRKYQMYIAGNSIISTKLSNRFLDYTTSGYSNYVTIKPFIDRPDRVDTTESIDEIPKTENRIKIIPILRSEEEYSDSTEDRSPIENRTYVAKNAGFMNMAHGSSKKTTLKPLIHTLSSLLLDTDNQSASHQLPKQGQRYYVDHLSSTIINDYVGKTQQTEQPPPAEASVLQSTITMNHQPPLPNKSNNQNTTNSRWTQPLVLYTINNNDGINDRDQKIKDINLDNVITTDGPTANRNQIFENQNDDGDEWNDGNVDGNSRALNGYGRVNVEPNIEWIMVAKSSKQNVRSKNSRAERLTSSSYKDDIIPMAKKDIPKVNNSNVVLGTNILVQ